MPKAILEYNLPEESSEYELAMNAGKYHSMLYEIYNYARGLRKYDPRETVPTEEVAEKLYELIAGFDI
jgi:hypothetical protein